MKNNFEYIKKIDFEAIDNLEQAKALLVICFNLIEDFNGENLELKEIIQKLSDEINRLKGEQGKPDIAANNNNAANKKDKEGDNSTDAKDKNNSSAADSNINSEKERKPRDGAAGGDGKKTRGKQKPIYKDADTTKVVKCEVDKSKLPPDAKSKGYKDHTVYSIEIKSVKTIYRIEQYYSKAEGKTYSGNIPENHSDKTSSDLKSYIIDMYHGCRMTESKIFNFLKQHGIPVSPTNISDILIKKNIEIFNKEKQEIQKAGIAVGNFTGIDDTPARVKGINQYVEILSGKYFTTFNTVEKKNRLNVIATIQGLKNDEDLKFFSCPEAIEILKEFKVAAITIDKLLDLPLNTVFTRIELESQLDSLDPQLKTHPQKYSRILEALAIAYYNHQEDYPVIENLLCDDAPQFKKITLRRALCWVHDGRNYKKLKPLIDKFQTEIDAYLKKYWDFYHKLLDYKKAPSREEAQKLELEFDVLFSTKVTYDKLQERINKTLLNKTELLLVLENPNIPLHNNESELAARLRVVRRNISLHTISIEGTEALDTYLSIYDTCRKLGIIPFEYIKDRISGKYEMQALADIIKKRAENDMKKTIVINEDNISNTITFQTAPIKKVPKRCRSI